MGKAIEVFRMPTPVTVMGRSSSITNSFINGIIPARYPSEEDLVQALVILRLNPEDLRCAYCGEKATEWDHFRPLISAQEPTGYISEIQNLVPACGKCNQSKGNSHWRDWILGNARLSPRVRGVADLDARIARLQRFEEWRPPTKLNIPEVVGEQLWAEYRSNWRELLDAMRRSDTLAAELRAKLGSEFGSAARTRSAQSRSPRSEDTGPGQPMSADEKQIVISRIRGWSTKPDLNVHRIIGILVRAGGAISRDELTT
jgi:hypothetical protein